MLIAGIGNIFLGDDGFGVEVAKRLSGETLPAEVTVRDYGIRGLHLAYEMMDGGYDTTVFVDAVPRGGQPGSLYLIEPEVDQVGPAAAEAHAMNPANVIALLKTMGGVPGRVLIVGCEPASVEEGIGLTAPVANAVGEAVQFVRDIIAREQLEVH